MVASVPPWDPEARAILEAYFAELVSRYQHRPPTAEQVRGAMVEAPSDDLAPPTGLLLLARRGTVAVGCIGLRHRPNRVGQVTRVFVSPSARRQGIAYRLLAEVENVARQHGIRRLQLDTRDDLVEARRLYARYGFAEVPAFNSDKYAEHWFAKALGT
jgi:GNAT superfamily N-acetyltransferase